MNGTGAVAVVLYSTCIYTCMYYIMLCDHAFSISICVPQAVQAVPSARVYAAACILVQRFGAQIVAALIREAHVSPDIKLGKFDEFRSASKVE